MKESIENLAQHVVQEQDFKGKQWARSFIVVINDRYKTMKGENDKRLERLERIFEVRKAELQFHEDIFKSHKLVR